MSPLSPEMQAELARLHDIRLPPPVGSWPLAPGWWVLFALLLVVIMVALALEYRRRRTVRYIALRELSGLKARLAAKAPAPDVATELAVLLRRVVLSGPEARKFAAVSGQGWAAELGRGPGGLSQGVAAWIANAPYAPANRDQAEDDLRRAMAEAGTWIRRHS